MFLQWTLFYFGALQSPEYSLNFPVLEKKYQLKAHRRSFSKKFMELAWAGLFKNECICIVLIYFS